MALKLNDMQGNEIADDYNRKYVPQGRWSDTWTVVKTNFWKLVVLNLIMLVTFAPGIAVIYIRSIYITGMGMQFPFNSSILYPFYPDVQGLTERVTLSADILFYALLMGAAFFAALGVSGASYCIRKLLHTHDEFTIKGFFHGIKVSYFNTLMPIVLFLLFFYMTVIVGDWMRINIAMGENAAGAIVAYVFAVIVTVLLGLYLGWIFSVGVSYRVKLKYLFKNSFILFVGTPVQTIFMAGFALLPVWLMFLGGFFQIIAYIVMAFMGFSFILICWISFSQWTFDMFIAPAIKTEKEAAKAKKSPQELAAEKAEEDKRIARELLAAGRSELIARPIMPIAEETSVKSLGFTFTRSQLSGAAAERAKLASDIAAYENEHMNDPVYAEYNKMFAEREKALVTPGDKKSKKAKKISSDNLLR